MQGQYRHIIIDGAPAADKLAVAAMKVRRSEDEKTLAGYDCTELLEVDPPGTKTKYYCSIVKPFYGSVLI